MTSSRVFLIAWAALVVCVSIGAPLAQATGWEHPGAGAMFARILGHGALGAGMLLLVHAPLFVVLCRLRRVTPPVAALIGAAIPLAAVLLISNPTAETWNEKVAETIQTYLDHPELFASEWLSLVVGGAIFGFLYSRQRSAERRENPAV